MGKYIIAGNWKMNKLPSETYDFVKEVVEATKDASCEVVLLTCALLRLLRRQRVLT